MSSFPNMGGKENQVANKDDGTTINESRHGCLWRGDEDGEGTGSEGANSESSE
jgi:hypothetical protein